MITVTRQEDGGGADYTYTASYTETWRCGAGLVPLTARQDYTTNGSGGEYVGWGEIQFEATGPTLPTRRRRVRLARRAGRRCRG